MAKVFVSTRFKRPKMMGNDPKDIDRMSYRYQDNFQFPHIIFLILKSTMLIQLNNKQE